MKALHCLLEKELFSAMLYGLPLRTVGFQDQTFGISWYELCFTFRNVVKASALGQPL